MSTVGFEEVTPVDQFYIESTSNLLGDGTSSPTSKKEEVLQANIGEMSKSLNEHMYLVVRSLKRGGQKIEYEIKKGDIIKLGRLKFAVKEIAIVDNSMEVDDPKASKQPHVEQVDDAEFFEFQEVRNYVDNQLEDETPSEGSEERA